MLNVFFLIVVGLAGDPEHGKTFHKWGTTLAQASERLGVAPERLVYLVDAPIEGDARVTGRSTRDEITKALESFATLFGGYFVDALTSDVADADRNKRISVLEAFTYAKTEVEKAYKREGLLATEHAILDDNGDKEGSGDPSPQAKDGKVASVLSLGLAEDSALPSDPKLRALHLERRDLERRVEALRLLKDSMEPARYTKELESLVTAVALKTREIRTAEGK